MDLPRFPTHIGHVIARNFGMAPSGGNLVPSYK